jgi:hypothetical protein
MGGWGEAALIVGAVAAVAAAGVGAYAASEQASAQDAAARYNRQVALNEMEAKKNAAALEARRVREEAELLKSRQRAIVGSSGFEESGSMLDAMITTAQLAERDAQIVQYTGQVNAASEAARAGLFGYQAKVARRAGAIGAGSSLLTGVSNVAQIYAQPRVSSASSGGGV